jgi:hypothetical protein
MVVTAVSRMRRRCVFDVLHLFGIVLGEVVVVEVEVDVEVKVKVMSEKHKVEGATGDR